MTEEKTPEVLALNSADYVATAAKAVLGAVPFAGSLLAELAGAIIPNQRIDRIVRFASELNVRLEGIEEATLRAHLSNENFTDLLEEGLRQAARSTTDERLQHIAQVIANSLTSEDVSFIESKHLLRILGEINDIEVIWLRSYLHPSRDGDEEFREKHADLLKPIAAHLGSPQEDVDQETMQQSYKGHLCRLELLRERYKIDPKTKMPEYEASKGRPRIVGYELTPIGQLLLRHMGLGNESA
jgi:hypothetical protein